jgi:hypothetical protein
VKLLLIIIFSISLYAVDEKKQEKKDPPPIEQAKKLVRELKEKQQTK